MLLYFRTLHSEKFNSRGSSQKGEIPCSQGVGSHFERVSGGCCRNTTPTLSPLPSLPASLWGLWPLPLIHISAHTILMISSVLAPVPELQEKPKEYKLIARY